jgi:hypothetical protein
MPGLAGAGWLRLRTFFSQNKVILGVWVLLAVIASAKQLLKDSYNNYLIFKGVFWHAVQQMPIYPHYPAEYFDKNHYGPFFSVIIAPFAVLPDFLGAFLWQLGNTLFLYWAISRLPLKNPKKVAIYWIIAHEALTAMFSFQINSGITALLILSLCFIREKKNFWAACMIMIGTFIKLYGIVGLAFFFFSRQKPKFILSCFFWAVVCLCLPMVFFGPEYILQSYQDWYVSLQGKNLSNTVSDKQDISVMGMARRIFGDPSIPNLPFLGVGLVLFLLPYLRVRLYQNTVFQLMLLASVLLFLVLFSTGSESPTYIIAFTGVAIWYVLQERPVKPLYVGLLKALPCLLIWLVVVYQQLTGKFTHVAEITGEPDAVAEREVPVSPSTKR